jgi:hypothetical protein
MAAYRRKALRPKKRRTPNGDSTLDMVLIGAGVAAAYFAMKMFMQRGGGGGKGGGGALPPGGGFDPSLVGGNGGGNGGGGGLSDMLVTADSKRTTPVVTPSGDLIMNPPPPTAWEPMRPNDAKFLKSHMNRIASKLKTTDGKQWRLGPNGQLLREDDQFDVNALKAFWVFMHMLWIANHIVGDQVLLGNKHADPQFVSEAGNKYRMAYSIGNWFKDPVQYNYVPLSEHLGRSRPSDYAIYKLSSTSTPNLTGAASPKLITYLRSVADVEPSPQDLFLMQAALDEYRGNPDYTKKPWHRFMKGLPPIPHPYPKEWPTKIH